MSRKAAIKAEADRLRGTFEARGAEVFETDVLQPAGALLDLYGEDIRARAFVTHDPLRGEMMLRPDFTIPLVQRHMREGRGQGRYTYAGEVFRRQEDDPDRASEYFQVGFELFDGQGPAQTDAEVFATFAEILLPLGLKAAMGDIGLLRAAVEGLPTSAARKAALLHHLWRPRRFRSLLGRYAKPGEDRAILQSSDPLAGKVEVGLRTAEEILARLHHLRDDREVPPLPRDEIALVDALLAVRGKAHDAVSQLRDLAIDLPSIGAAVDRLTDRFDALEGRGVDLRRLDFEAAYGRTTLEYYDGFVFGFYAEGRPGLPPVASGGRYDALTRAIGGGDGVPAVGGVIRPGLLIDLGMAA
ncbi:ATP phosphoribosyltransferase regulatory subunit [Silicimonas algicola]|uniref:ATP phosphoribosyltransferase regulatory subunit n=1 Tax=Silicimonas algicola TaxID=1826607 RepID=A0A316G4Y9_9RHOB|nr:ATP phosphoribosyltransferase regulatory subunit [Silicimonas algicola]AZQ68910.1 ATP phosphoribosyltransferase regulatory subunit [Silicimonas algicola]PWK55991.1 ATP phosphoribosyltransferase regulatory subunit [Silicimonas algicola]